jgi:hypothetical protein
MEKCVTHSIGRHCDAVQDKLEVIKYITRLSHIKCVTDEVTDCVDQCKGIRQGSNLSPYTFNISVEIIDYY